MSITAFNAARRRKAAAEKAKKEKEPTTTAPDTSKAKDSGKKVEKAKKD